MTVRVSFVNKSHYIRASGEKKKPRNVKRIVRELEMCKLRVFKFFKARLNVEHLKLVNVDYKFGFNCKTSLKMPVNRFLFGRKTKGTVGKVNACRS